MQLNPYLSFNGQCEAAFKFYENCLGGKIEAMLTHEGTPAEQGVPPEWRKKNSSRPPDRRRSGVDGFRRTARPL